MQRQAAGQQTENFLGGLHVRCLQAGKQEDNARRGYIYGQ